MARLNFRELAVLAAFILVIPARGDDPDWPAMPYTPHADYQAVDQDGFATFPLTNPVKMRGVIINDPTDMLDPVPGSDPFMGGQWQIYVQAAEPDDFGGTACWMGQNIGKLNGTHPEGSYTDEQWLAELDRLSHDPNSGYAFQRGDLIEIHARAPGLAFRGKTNINEQHSNNPAANFDICLLEADYGLPTPELITLSDVKDPNDVFIFDPERLVGAEHYQGSLVRVNDVSFVSAQDWGPEGELVLADDTGRTIPVKLGRGCGFDICDPPPPPFDIIAIFDQEDLNSDDGYLDGYRLWVMNYDGNGEVINGEGCIGDLDADGDVDLADLAELLGHYGATSSATCADGDLDRDGDVDLADLAELLGAYGTSCW
jgi:hypothetical protein